MKLQGRSPALQPPIAVKGLEVSREFSFELRKVCLTKAVFRLRYYLTKVFVREEALEDFEKVALHLYCQQIEEVSDRNWISANSLRWLSLKMMAEIVRTTGPLPVWQTARITIFKRTSRVFLSPRAYLGQEKLSSKDLFKRTNRNLFRTPKPPAYIGVGYRDKGNARIKHLDGSPSWQEVASIRKMSKRKSELIPTFVGGSSGFLRL